MNKLSQVWMKYFSASSEETRINIATLASVSFDMSQGMKE